MGLNTVHLKDIRASLKNYVNDVTHMIHRLKIEIKNSGKTKIPKKPVSAPCTESIPSGPLQKLLIF